MYTIRTSAVVEIESVIAILCLLCKIWLCLSSILFLSLSLHPSSLYSFSLYFSLSLLPTSSLFFSFFMMFLSLSYFISFFFFMMFFFLSLPFSSILFLSLFLCHYLSFFLSLSLSLSLSRYSTLSAFQNVIEFLKGISKDLCRYRTQLCKTDAKTNGSWSSQLYALIA